MRHFYTALEIDHNKFSMLRDHWEQFNDIIEEFCEEYVNKMNPDYVISEGGFDWSIHERDDLHSDIVAKFWASTGLGRATDDFITFPLWYVCDPDWESIERQKRIDEQIARLKAKRMEKKLSVAAHNENRRQLYDQLKKEFGD